ncbi:MAG: FCD domain-containing protein [Propionibacteriaceae bacterium]|nr:FCD domain-containing protein [Propionibacteriaceae bacterium]
MGAVDVARSGLCRMIASGQLQCGQPLPGEVELCERFGVSRSSLREAQKMLVVAGVLTSEPGSRTFVSQMTPQQIMSGLEIVVPLLPLDRFLGLFPLREVLEGHTAAQAAARMSDADRVRLLSVAHELGRTEPSERAQELDAEFHQLIIHSAEDPLIEALLEAIRRRGRDYHIFDTGDGAQLKPLSDKAHVRIAEAISRRDPESARFLAMEHVRTTRRWLEGLQPHPTL